MESGSGDGKKTTHHEAGRFPSFRPTAISPIPFTRHRASVAGEGFGLDAGLSVATDPACKTHNPGKCHSSAIRVSECHSGQCAKSVNVCQNKKPAPSCVTPDTISASPAPPSARSSARKSRPRCPMNNFPPHAAALRSRLPPLWPGFRVARWFHSQMPPLCPR